MRIIWALDGNCFEAVLTPGALWQKDLEAVKAAGFRASGPPDWRWQAMNVKAVMKLRANKPESGLSISPEALAKYTPQAEQETKNEEIKKQLAEGRKALKKETKQTKPKEDTILGRKADKGYLDASDFPPVESVSKPFILDMNREYKLCSNCGDEVETFLYAPTEPEPQYCIWCQKVLDKI
jgi:hypothetical protein